MSASFDFQDRALPSPISIHHPTPDFHFAKVNSSDEKIKNIVFNGETTSTNMCVGKNPEDANTKRFKFISKPRALFQVQFKEVLDVQSLKLELQNLVLADEVVMAFILPKELLPSNVEVYDTLFNYLQENTNARLAFNRQLYFLYEFNFKSVSKIANVLQKAELANQLIRSSAANKEFIAIGGKPIFSEEVALVNPFLLEEKLLLYDTRCTGILMLKK